MKKQGMCNIVVIVNLSKTSLLKLMLIAINIKFVLKVNGIVNRGKREMLI